MKSTRTTHIAAFVAALVMSIAVNGGMLLKFDAVSQQAATAHETTDGNHATVLATVTVVGHRS